MPQPDQRLGIEDVSRVLISKNKPLDLSLLEKTGATILEIEALLLSQDFSEEERENLSST